MILNFILLGLVFGAAKRKYSPYAAAGIFGAVKATLYFLAARNVLVAGLAFLVFTGLTAGMVYLLSRIDRKEATEDPYPKYGTKKKGPFKWEYVPLSTIALLLLFGETMANFVLA